MPDKNATSWLKSNTDIEIAKLPHHKYLRLGIFLSLPLVIQIPGLSKPTHAWDVTSSFKQPLTKVKKSWKSVPQQSESRFLPRIFNLIAFSPKSQSVNSFQKLNHPHPVADRPSYQANNKSLSKPQPIIHQVKPGETITKIASMYQVSSHQLIKINQIADSNVIFVDQRLQIPLAIGQGGGLDEDHSAIANSLLPKIQDANGAKTLYPLTPKTDSSKVSQPTIKPAETPLSPEETPYITNLRAEIEQLRIQYQQEQAVENKTSSATSISLGEQQVSPTTKSNSALPQRSLKSNQLKQDSLALMLPPLPNSEEYLPSTFDGYIWPAQGVLTSGYGWRWGRLHQGIDIAAPIGTPIVAAASGEVISAGWHGGYGNLIKLEHLDGSTTVYAHNNRNLVSHGQRVKQGEQIAEMGSTGNSTGSHLHFEIRLRNQKVANPLALLSSR